MQLSIISALDLPKIVGTIEERLDHDLVIIGANPDNSEYLVISTNTNSSLVHRATIPEGFIFMYRQEWGLAITEDIIRRVKKDVRDSLVAKLTVSLSTGESFDADEVSQARMSRAIIALPADTATIPWVLEDNSTMLVNKAQLSEVLLKAGTAQSNLWVKYQ